MAVSMTTQKVDEASAVVVNAETPPLECLEDVATPVAALRAARMSLMVAATVASPWEIENEKEIYMYMNLVVRFDQGSQKEEDDERDDEGMVRRLWICPGSRWKMKSGIGTSAVWCPQWQQMLRHLLKEIARRW
jgi:hypothetical protein